jgi:endonuclease G, mitochondrial
MLNTATADRLVDALMLVPDAKDEKSVRTAMLKGIPVALTRSDNAFTDFNNIVTQLDNLGRLSNGERPVVILARNAARSVRGTDLGRQLDALAEEVEAAYGEEPLSTELSETPEALIFGGEGEWVTSTFLEQARKIGTRVARMLVPRIVAGREEKSVGILGTGWLIGPRLLLTNHHVINSRERGEPAATTADFNAQGARAIAWFDYYVEGGARVEVSSVEVVKSDASLDYALLRLADGSALADRAPLVVPQNPRTLNRGVRMNIVQCPNGGPLRFAIRNNFFVGRGEMPFQIRYLTDTVQGSSGSPVMDDDWQVVALHQSAQKVNPVMYSREPGIAGLVKFHNQGIDIHAILANLPPAAAADIKKAQAWT